MTIESRATPQWQSADAAHLLHPFSDAKELASKGIRVIKRADGIYIWDTDDNKILDAMSGLWCVNMGYGQSSLINAATKQLHELPFYNTFFQTSTPPAIELAEKLASVSPPGFDHVFFTNSGSEGNDTILRLVRRYWDVLGQPERRIIISRENAYHGSTLGGASLGGMKGMHQQAGLPIPGIEHIGQPDPWVHREPDGSLPSAHEFGLRAARWLEERILQLGADKVAAFIGEPVQGAGGVIVPPESYWPEIQRICDRYGILLISDEVIAGFGRTGQWWGSQTMGFKPDLMTFAKGVTSGYIPLGGVMVGSRVYQAVFEQGGEFEHGFTYSGHPVACAVGIANIELMQSLGTVDKVREELAPRLASGLEQLKSHPLVGGYQQAGLMASLVLVQDKPSGRFFGPGQAASMICRKHCFANGLVMRAVGNRMVIAPPLVITLDEIDQLLGLIKLCLDKTWLELKSLGWVSDESGG